MCERWRKSNRPEACLLLDTRVYTYIYIHTRTSGSRLRRRSFRESLPVRESRYASAELLCAAMRARVFPIVEGICIGEAANFVHAFICLRPDFPSVYQFRCRDSVVSSSAVYVLYQVSHIQLGRSGQLILTAMILFDYFSALLAAWYVFFDSCYMCRNRTVQLLVLRYWSCIIAMLCKCEGNNTSRKFSAII